MFAEVLCVCIHMPLPLLRTLIFNKNTEKPMSWKKIWKYYKRYNYIFSCLYVQTSLHEDSKGSCFVHSFFVAVGMSLSSCSCFPSLPRLLPASGYSVFLKDLFQVHLPLWIILQTLLSEVFCRQTNKVSKSQCSINMSTLLTDCNFVLQNFRALQCLLILIS